MNKINDKQSDKLISKAVAIQRNASEIKPTLCWVKKKQNGEKSGTGRKEQPEKYSNKHLK